VDKISPIKNERKYQYVTVLMPSMQSKTKAVIRIETQQYLKIFGGYEKEEDGTHRILAGYICRKSFPCEDGTVKEWMEFLKGVVFRVSEHGLYAEDCYVATVLNYLCKNHIIFKRPYFPLENYGSEIPTLLVERLNKKDLIVDVVSERIYRKRQPFGEDNEEYECFFIKTDDDLGDQLDKLLDLLL